MFDDRRDFNRDPNFRDPYSQPYANLSDSSGWGLPLALLAIVIIVGALIAFTPNTNQQTAQRDPSAPAIQRSAPPPAAPAPVAPAPRTTAPQQ